MRHFDKFCLKKFYATTFPVLPILKLFCVVALSTLLRLCHHPCCPLQNFLIAPNGSSVPRKHTVLTPCPSPWSVLSCLLVPRPQVQAQERRPSKVPPERPGRAWRDSVPSARTTAWEPRPSPCPTFDLRAPPRPALRSPFKGTLTSIAILSSKRFSSANTESGPFKAWISSTPLLPDRPRCGKEKETAKLPTGHRPRHRGSHSQPETSEGALRG